MLYRGSIGALALSAALSVSLGDARAADAKYPELEGQWISGRMPPEQASQSFDPTKPAGAGQQAPLTPEYQKVLEESLADQARAAWATIRPRNVTPAACRA